MPRPVMLLIASALLGCRLANVAHPGTITYERNGVVTKVSPAEDVPEGMRFADEAPPGGSPGRLRRVPIVEVDGRDMGPGRMEILEYGPGHELLRTTIAFVGPAVR